MSSTGKADLSSSNSAREVRRPRAMFYLNQAHHAVRSRLESALGQREMTSIQYTVLSVIGRHEGLSSAELSRRFYVTPQTMNELIGGLDRRGLILREADPANRRILRMRLTREGRGLLDHCDALADQVEQEVFGSLSDDDYEAFAELTRKVAQALRKREEKGG